MVNLKISLIAAIGRNRELGKNNKLLWHIPEDFRRFKELTKGHPMIMGRKTFESIGRVLPDRVSIVVTRDTRGFLEKTKKEGMDVRGLIAVDSFDAALSIARNKKALEAGMENVEIDVSEIFVIGGGQIFEQAISVADKLYLTIVDRDFEADVYFPEYNDKFLNEVYREERNGEGYRYIFSNLER